MKDNCLYRVVPVLKEINEDSWVQLERYFSTAPDWLLKSIIVEEVPAGTVFIREGEPADTIYFVANGTIKATDYRIFGIPYDFMMIRKKVYAYGGMEVIMEIGRYQATIQTVDRCLVLKLPRSQFEQWLSTDFAAMKYEAKLVMEYLHEETRNSRAFLFLQGSDRVALLLVNRYEKYADGGVFRMRGSRKDLSDSTGLCLKTINRSVKKFCDEDMMTQDGRDLTINYQQYLKLKQIVTTILAEDL